MADRPAFWSRPALRPALRTCAIGGGAAVGGAALWRQAQQQQQQRRADDALAAAPRPKLKLSAAAIEAFAGAMGEMAQISLLYPLDTIKVRCQAQGIPARAVIASLSGLGPRELAAQLFAGAGQAAVSSVLVGAVHFMSFCSAKRLVAGRLGPRGAAAEQQQQQQQQHEQRRAGGGGEPRGDGEDGGGEERAARQRDHAAAPHHEHHLVVSHGASGAHFTPVSEVLGSGDESCSGGGGGEPAGAGGHAHSHGGGSAAVNLAAAVLAAVATAMVEAPLELFRHNAQAGTGAMGGDFLGAMWRVARDARSPLPLYRGLTAYSLEAIPYDVSELVVVGSLNDGRAAAEAAAAAGGGSGGALASIARGVPQSAWDVGVGAIAGAAAVVASMPCDVVKTYMQVNPTCGGGLRGFAAAARLLIARGGPGALWLGLAPRLAHQVPGACICWWSIHAVHRHMMEHHHHDSPDAPAAAA
ncbi:MAG: mitochondrial carrier domain-containing protein [Monoraphidium minutum]|nr:MAG: mitochondrial carrier domain-containing protein [Monoraphidium minutum]